MKKNYVFVSYVYNCDGINCFGSEFIKYKKIKTTDDYVTFLDHIYYIRGNLNRKITILNWFNF